MDRRGKEQLREEVAGRLKSANAVIVAEYRGLTVEEITELRLALRKANATFTVTKNRVVLKAIENEAGEYDDLKPELKGPVGILYSEGDSAQATKVALEFEKSHPNFVVKAGMMENSLLSVDQLKAIADLPSKEVLIGQIVGSLVAPHRGLVGVLSGVPRQLVQVLNAIKDTKSA